MRLTVGADVQTRTFRVMRDPRLECSDADLAEQFEFLLAIRDEIGRIHSTINSIRRLRERVGLERNDVSGVPRRLAPRVRTVARELRNIEERLVQVRSMSRQDNLNYPARLNAKLAALALSVGSADGPVTQAQRRVFAQLARSADAAVQRWESLPAREPALWRAMAL